VDGGEDARQGRDLDVSRACPWTTRPTFDLLNRGDTVAVFQVESKGMRDMLRKIGVGRFEDLIALIALFRPAPCSSWTISASARTGAPRSSTTTRCWNRS
jgi:DNA polymerase III alpha subunit